MKTPAADIFKTRLVVGLLTVLSLAVVSTGRATAQGVIRIGFCPFVITAPGQYLVTQDLFCAVHGITIQSSDVNLNLGGHTITGTARGGGGIVVRSAAFFTPLTNVEVRNGAITNFSRGIVLEFVNGSRIDAVTSTANSGGLQLENSHDNTITSSEFSNNTSVGVFTQASNGNVFRGNKLTGNVGAGYFLFFGNNNLITSSRASASIITGNQTVGVLIGGFSENNTVQSSQIVGNLIHGIRLADNSNTTTVKGNTVNENGSAGIFLALAATANIIVNNTARDNVVFDLEDQNPNCDANVWRNNNFNTANQPQCID